MAEVGAGTTTEACALMDGAVSNVSATVNRARAWVGIILITLVT